VQLPTREVEIYRWELLDFAGGQHPTALTEVQCSKGTYVRSLAEMLGQELGTGAYLSFLVRSQVGPHRLEDAHTLAQIATAAQDGTIDKLLLPPLAVVSHLPQVQIDQALVGQVRNGTPVPLDSGSDYSGPVAVISDDQALLAIAESSQRQQQQWLQPRKVFDWST
ncbi:MAG: tRNA pseudouridine(55) synthase TruB, partial [Armatimonadetes bacterium]|nr:tRNA pseudouridine(55) synthase TruB [Armatimonadota bacterium]